jgi:hypothetical protein
MGSSRVAVVIKGIPGAPEDKPLKILVERTKTMGELMMWVRVHSKLSSKKALFMFIGSGVLPANTQTVGAVHDEHKSRENGYLYITLKAESVFG